jgi:2-dehydropantoate 2-reductase
VKFTIVGAGAIGGFLGARLALAGHEVAFLARNRNLAAINAHGFRLIEEDGSERHAGTVRAVASVAEAGPADAVLLTVKAHQVVDLLPALKDGLGAQTMLVTMVNGLPWWYFQRLDGRWQGRVLDSVDPGGALAAAFDPGCIIGSVVYPAAELVEPGLVRVIEGNRFSLGELDGQRSARVEALSQALMGAGFKAPVSRDIRGELWVKLWGNLSFNPISALTHATLEDIGRFPPTRELARRMMAEAQAVAEALGVRFRITLDQRLAGAEAVGTHKTSMLQDIEAGCGLELAALVGAVIELGQVVDLPTPNIEAVHAATALLARTLAAGPSRLRPEPA